MQMTIEQIVQYFKNNRCVYDLKLPTIKGAEGGQLNTELI
jgi:hypothetical protein